MTDKQIIINKMDKPKRYCEGIDCAWCNEKEPCIYKIANELEEKLLRKEQECEKIKNWVKGMMFYTDCSNWFERFTTAFEDWKNDLISQLDQLKGENVGVLKQLEFVRTLNTVQEAEIRKLTKTLAEIKKIAENSCCLQPTSDCEEYENCKECSRISDDETVKQILQKISEVEECKP